MPTRILLIMLTVLSLLLSACSLPNPLDQTEWSGRVGADVKRVEVGRAVVTFPEGVAPSGTEATVKVTSAAESVPPSAVSLSPAIEITLDGDLQPAAPVQIVVPLDEDGPDPATIADQYWLFGSATSSDGTEEFLTGSYDQVSNTFSMTADHFSNFRVLGIDVGDVMGEVRTAIMQGLALEFPAPECTDNAVDIAGTQYEVFSYPEAHLCLDDDQGNLVVTAHPAIGMPYIITTTPEGDAVSSPTEVTLSTSGMIVLANALGLTRGDGTTGLFPGAKATFTLDGAPTAVRLDFQQEPGLLLMMILAKTLDVLGLTSIEALGNLQCLADVIETNSSLNNGLGGEAVGTLAKAFFSCAENAADLSPLGKFLLAAIGTAPGLLITAVIGIINEFTGAGRRSVNILVTPPIRPSNQADHQKTTSPIMGTWTGTVTQPGSGNYTVRVTLKENLGSITGHVEYPELECRGSWIMVKSTAEALHFEETITHGNRCVEQVDIHIRIFSGDQLLYDVGPPYEATATLMRGQNPIRSAPAGVTGWPTNADDASPGLMVWFGSASVSGNSSVGFPEWVSCVDESEICIAGDNTTVSVVEQATSGFHETHTVPINRPARESLLELGLDESLVEELLSGG